MIKRLNLNFLVAAVAIIVPILLVFRSFFTEGHLAFGDAPYFNQEGLAELVSEPSAWTYRGSNFGAVNALLWLSPVMFFYGLVNKVIGLNNDLIIRLLFYFPSLLLSVISPFLLVRYFNFSKKTGFFASLVYTLNTYYLLVVDGGQVGVAVAYGLFPLSFLLLKKLYDNPSLKSIYLALGGLFLLSIFDPRIAIVCILASAFFLSRKGILPLFVVLVSLVAVSSYWIIPMIKNGVSVLDTYVADIRLYTLMNPLLLFQPHWPLNQFGKVSFPPFYYVLVPLVVFGGLAIKSKRSHWLFALALLFFAFLVKGSNEPFGFIYQRFLSLGFFGQAFRDSSKFFIPTVLFSGILIGLTCEKIKSWYFLLTVYILILLLISPAILGRLNFVLSTRPQTDDLSAVNNNLQNDSNFFRVAWFDEKPPLGYESYTHPGINAKDLVKLRGFSSLNIGGYDHYNFMHYDQYLPWFKLLGVKYLVFSGNPRSVLKNKEELANWSDLNQRVATQSGLIKKDWNDKLAVYENPDVSPRFFKIDKLVAVVGGDDILVKTDPTKMAAVYFEDGLLDSRDLLSVLSDSLDIYFNHKDSVDLAMSFLKKYFKGGSDLSFNQWAYYAPADYLEWRFQLLMRGLDTREFDYGKGINMSTQNGEKMGHRFFVKNNGEYVLAARFMGKSDSQGLLIRFNGESLAVPVSRPGYFEWFAKEVSLKRGEYDFSVQNQGGLMVVNTFSLIPKIEWKSAAADATSIEKKFGVIDDLSVLGKAGNWPVGSQRFGVTNFKIEDLAKGYWLIFTDKFDSGWKLRRGVEYTPSLPVYSMINGFYTEPKWGNLEVAFTGQEYVRWGMYFSLVAILILAVALLYFYPKRNDRKG